MEKMKHKINMARPLSQSLMVETDFLPELLFPLSCCLKAIGLLVAPISQHTFLISMHN